MRTTLKRGLGRGAAPNGNGKAVLPPGSSSPVTFYRQPERSSRSRARLIGQVAMWLGIACLVVATGTAGGAYLYFHESVAAVAAKTPEVRRAARTLDVALPGQPAVALVIGYDHRKDDGGPNTSGRSDTLMLVRADPSSDSISLLSFPRDMRVEIRCPGRTGYFDKINAAYATCGPQGSLQTVRALTGVQINYLITVNFRGFRQIVDRLDGAWIDVDRRYFNDRGGPFGYAKINLRPGYQQLTGRQTLDYVRYRHTDSDLYRVARQQQFVKAFKGQVQSSFAPLTLPKVVNAITKNVEVAQGGGRDVSGDTVLSYALFAYGLPKGRVFQTRIEGLEGFADLTTDSENITKAVTAFTHPDVESSEKATAVALGEKLKTRTPAPRATTITVLNGNGVEGSATTAGYQLGQRGLSGAHSAERLARQRAVVRLLPDEGVLRQVAARRAGGRQEGREPLRLRRARAASSAALAARATARCWWSSSGRRSTGPSHRRRSTRLPSASGRTSPTGRTRPSTSSASGAGASRSR